MDKRFFLEQYNKVFDKNGNILPCGREECKKLISFCDEMSVDYGFLQGYGDEKNGFMNVKKIKALYGLVTNK